MKNKKEFDSDVLNYQEYLGAYENKSINTIKTYMITLKNFKKYLLITKISYLNLSNKNAVEFIKYLKLKNNNLTYINTKLYSIRSFYRYLKLIKKVKQNSFDIIRSKNVTVETKPDNFVIISIPEFKNIIKNIEMNSKPKYVLRNKLIFSLLYYTGIRVSELCSITKGNFNHNFTILKVTGKGSKENTINLNKELNYLLLKYINELEIINKKVISETTPLFEKQTSTGCEVITRQGIFFIIQCFTKDKFEHVTPHSLRYSFATNLLKQGKNIYELQSLLKHNNIVTTMKYISIDNSKLKQKTLAIQNKFESSYDLWQN